MVDVILNERFDESPGQGTDIRYDESGLSPLFSSIGRVFVTVVTKPEWSQGEIARHLHVSESRVSKAILSLVQQKILVRTRVGRVNKFKIHPEAAQNHPDIRNFLLLQSKFQ